MDQQYFDLEESNFLRNVVPLPPPGQDSTAFSPPPCQIQGGPPTIAQNLNLFQVPVANNPCIIPSAITSFASDTRNKKKYPTAAQYKIKLPSTLEMVKQVELIQLEFSDGLYNVDHRNDRLQFSESKTSTNFPSLSQVAFFTTRIAHGLYSLNDLLNEVVIKMNECAENRCLVGTTVTSVPGLKPSNRYAVVESGTTRKLSIVEGGHRVRWQLPLGDCRNIRLTAISIPVANQLLITTAEDHGLATGTLIHLRNVVDPVAAGAPPAPPTTNFQAAWTNNYGNGYPLPQVTATAVTTVLSKTQFQISVTAAVAAAIAAWPALPWAQPLEGRLEYECKNSIAPLLGYEFKNHATHSDLLTTPVGAWTKEAELATMIPVKITEIVALPGSRYVCSCESPHFLRVGNTIVLRSEDLTTDTEFNGFITPFITTVHSIISPTIFRTSQLAGGLGFSSSSDSYMYYGNPIVGAPVAGAQPYTYNAPFRYDLTHPRFLFMKLTPMADDSVASVLARKEGTNVENWHGSFYFCKIQLSGGPLNVTFRQGNHKGQLKRWGAPVTKIRDLHIEFLNSDGTLANLNGLEHSFTLEWMIGK